MPNGNLAYKNIYTSLEDDLIGAVGTYFPEAGEEYTFEVYVNDELKLTQSGKAPFQGYHTIKLDKYVTINEGDVFSVVMMKKYLPLLENSRQHFESNMSFADSGEGWEDLSLDNKTASLKVYTIASAIITDDLVNIYKNDSKFEAKIGVANQTVSFEINGATYNRTSNEEGIAKMAINLNPGNYTIKTTYNGESVENTIIVLPTLIADNLEKIYRNASQFNIKLIDGEGNPIAGQNITMNINGVFYDRTTKDNGIAKLNINLNPGTYILTAKDPITGLQMSYNITVLPILEAEDVVMTYMDGTQFKASLVDGQGNPLANEKITFNINGVFYERTTNSDGIAKLNIKLMPGEYIITSQYGDARISNTITINSKED